MELQTKILVIDDDRFMSKILAALLARNNYDVCIANTGAQGIQKAFEYNPDLILCDIKMGPIDGFQVYNVLKESSLLDQIPFIFITSNSELDDIRIGLDLGADDYFVKPFDKDGLVKSIERRLSKYKKLKEIGKREFNALLKLSPNGIFLFNGDLIYQANPALMKILDFKEDDLSAKSIESILDPKSYQLIQEKIKRCSTGILNSFTENVTLITKNGSRLKVTLFISVYEKFSGYSLMIGLIAVNPDRNSENEIFASDVMKILKKENITVTESLGKNLADIFKQHGVNMKDQRNEFFSTRENEVLCLSMEGLPIKLIADRLSISDRTVEKHRTRMMDKTGCSNMIEVIVFALRNNLIEI